MAAENKPRINIDNIIQSVPSSPRENKALNTNPPKKQMAKSVNPSGRNSPVTKQQENKRVSLEGKNCVRKFAFATRVGFHPHNPNKVNQDSYILAPNVQGLPALHIFGICDGHG